VSAIISSKMVKRHAIVEEDLAQITAADLPWSDLNGAAVLITGANGFIAAYLVETLLYLNEQRRTERPITVFALVRNEAKARSRFSAYEGREDLQFIVQDVSDPLQIDRALDYIVHAASQASPKYYAPDPTGTFKPNVLGTYHLLEHARRYSTRGFLFISSGEVYGQFEPTPSAPIAEDRYGTLDPLALRSCYAEGKRAGETMCKAWSHQHGVPTRIARLGHTFGPGMDLNDGRVFADFVADIVRGENIVLKSDGTALRLFCYLADAVVGLFSVLLKGGDAEAYNVMNDEGGIRIGDLATTLCNLFPEAGLRVIREVPEVTVQAKVWNTGFPVSMKKLRSLGWRPSTSVQHGFRRTILSYRQPDANRAS
jgi:nucleoside-diphosphate-sugar epimerase